MIHPFVVQVPVSALGLRGEARVRDLSRRAREAAVGSARAAGFPEPRLSVASDGRPQADRDLYWSVAHKPTMVAGVVASRPVGIDIEWVRPRAWDQIEEVLSPEEHSILGGAPLKAYFRAWAAKEAVLKLTGVGLRGLSRAHIVSVRAGGARVVFDGERYDVAFAYPPGHVAAVTAGAESISWRFELSPEGDPPEPHCRAVEL